MRKTLLGLFFLAIAVVMLVVVFQAKKTKNHKNKWGERSIVKVGLTPLALPLDLAKIRSVSQYIAVEHLGRGLVKASKHGLFEGDLAKSWEISEDFKKYSFILKDGVRFSDGTSIMAEDVRCSYNRQKRLNSAIHFNFDSIKEIKTNGEKLVIQLQKPNPRFIHQLTLVEFDILNQNNCDKDFEQLDLSVTSGPYFLKEEGVGRVLMQQNPYFEEFSAPPLLEIVGMNRSELNEGLAKGQFDFCIGVGEYTDTELKDLQLKHNLTTVLPHIGFSYWLSVNEKNTDLKNKENRLFLSHVVHSGFEPDKRLEPFWSIADQLYLPDGDGRVPPHEVADFWLKLDGLKLKWSAKSPVRLLLRNKIWFENGIVQALEKEGVPFEVHYYKNLKEFAEVTKKYPNKYHLIQINNDYSSIDLYENLKLTLSSVRPLIFQESFQGKIDKLMEKAASEPEARANFKVYADIERLLLFEGLVIPVVYNHTVFFVRNDMSVNKWSKLYPEVSFWKITPK